MLRRAGELIHSNDGDNKQAKDDEGDDDVDDFVDTAGAVERDVFGRGFCLEFRGAEEVLCWERVLVLNFLLANGEGRGGVLNFFEMKGELC